MPPGRRVTIRACCGYAHRLSLGDIETPQIVSCRAGEMAEWVKMLAT